MKHPGSKKVKKKAKAAAGPSKAVTANALNTDIAAPVTQSGPAVWQPGQDPIDDEETLDFDPSAYECLHALTLDFPCLSFDVLKDSLGGPRTKLPHTLMLAAATQADRPRANYVAFLRLTNLRQLKQPKKAADGSEDEDMSSSDEDEDEEEEGGPPVLHVRKLALNSGANRIRSMPQKPGVVAVFEESGFVKIFDGTSLLEELAGLAPEAASTRSKNARPVPLHSHRHSSEGYAVDWSGAALGRLATGDDRAQIHVWEPAASSWAVGAAYKGHTASVEDLQWSPVEETVFASCSADRTVRIWDTRTRDHAMLCVEAHAADANVISWNRDTNFMLASGADDGALKVWDLRSFAQGAPVANFTHHKAAITSVEWCPTESSMLATTGAEGQLCVWDLALERDPEEEMMLADSGNATAPQDLPPQLLFVHGGQNDLKEVHWHPQIPGMLLSTAADGFNVFKPSNVG